MASFKKRGSTWQYTISHYVDKVRKPIVKGGFTTKKEVQLAAVEVETNWRKANKLLLKRSPFRSIFLNGLSCINLIDIKQPINAI